MLGNHRRNSFIDALSEIERSTLPKGSKIGYNFFYIAVLILETCIELEDEDGPLQKDEQCMLAFSLLIAQKLRNYIRELVMTKSCNCGLQRTVEFSIRFIGRRQAGEYLSHVSRSVVGIFAPCDHANQCSTRLNVEPTFLFCLNYCEQTLKKLVIARCHYRLGYFSDAFAST